MPDDLISIKLGLGGVAVIETRESEEAIEIEVEYKDEEAACPRCGHMTWQVHQRRRQRKEAVGADAPEVIEDYPEDPRGHSCLIRGLAGNGQVLHVVCKPSDPVFIVTCYPPDSSVWYPDFRKRRT